MKYLFGWGAILLTLFSSSVQGQLLWRVTGSGLSQPSYVFGTFHLTCRDQFQVDDSLKRAIDSVEGLVLEINLRDPSLLSDYIQSSRLPVGVTLTQSWSSAKRDSVRHLMKQSFQLELANYETLQPMVLISALYPKLLNCPTASYELYLMEQAQKRKMKITGLEKASDQLKAMAKIPVEKQLESVVEMIQDPAKSKKEFDELWELYRTKKVHELFNVTTKDPHLGDYQPILLDQRNENWMLQLPEIMKQTPSLIAVGAGHLSGPKGLLNLLKAAGYEVQPVY